MSSNRFHEYFDPVISSNENKAKAAFLKPGRYHGFDQIGMLSSQSTGDYDIGLFHGSGTEKGAIPVASTTNTYEELGYLVTTHGVVWASEYGDADSGVPLTVPLNSTGDDVFYVVLAAYSWVNSPGGSSVDISLETWVPSDPLAPDMNEFDSLSDTQFVIGYIRVQDGAKDFSKLTLVPKESPDFAWQDLGKANIAKRNEANVFKGFNSFNMEEGSGFGDFSYNGTTNTLTIGSPHNIFLMGFQTSPQLVKTLDWGIPEGGVGTIVKLGASTTTLSPGGNIYITKDIVLSTTDSFQVLKFNGFFYILSVGTTTQKLLDNLSISLPSQGDWTNLGFNSALVPDCMRVGNVSGGASSFTAKYKSDGFGGYFFRIRFQLYSATVENISYTVSDIMIGQNPSSLGYGTGESNPIIIPVKPKLVAGFQSGVPDPYVTISNSLTISFPLGPHAQGEYLSLEAHISNPT